MRKHPYAIHIVNNQTEYTTKESYSLSLSQKLRFFFYFFNIVISNDKRSWNIASNAQIQARIHGTKSIGRHSKAVHVFWLLVRMWFISKLEWKTPRKRGATEQAAVRFRRMHVIHALIHSYTQSYIHSYIHRIRSGEGVILRKIEKTKYSSFRKV